MSSISMINHNATLVVTMATIHETQDHFSALPEELCATIIDHLPVISVIKLAQTNKSYNRIREWDHPSRQRELIKYLANVANVSFGCYGPMSPVDIKYLRLQRAYKSWQYLHAREHSLDISSSNAANGFLEKPALFHEPTNNRETWSLAWRLISKLLAHTTSSTFGSKLCLLESVRHNAGHLQDWPIMARPQQQPRPSLNALPEELLSLIIDNHLPIAGIIALSQTSRKFHRLCDWRRPLHRQELISFVSTRQFCEICELPWVPGLQYGFVRIRGIVRGWIPCARCDGWTRRMWYRWLEFASDDDVLFLCNMHA